MRCALLLFAPALAAWSATAYDCRYFDCVTPFQAPAVPLPPGASIPQPVGWPGLPLTFTPQRAVVTGFVFGRASDGGSTGPFLFNGTETFVAIPWPDFVFHDLSDNGLILADEVSDAPFLTDLHGIHTPVGMAFNGPYEFLISPGGSALAVTRAGDAVLVRGVNRFEMIGPVLVETGLTMIFAGPSFQATPIPEPGGAGFFLLGIVGLVTQRWRRLALRH